MRALYRTFARSMTRSNRRRKSSAKDVAPAPPKKRGLSRSVITVALPLSRSRISFSAGGGETIMGRVGSNAAISSAAVT